MTQKNSNTGTITKQDLRRTFLRSLPLEWSWNYVKQQNLGFAYAMLPMIQKLYDKKEDQIEAYQRHLEFFNITPYLCTIPMGIALAMEEAKANGADIDEGTIGSIKIGLMGPFCGVGDPIFWGTLRPITAAIGASLALTGSALGPVLFFLAFNIVRMAALYFGLEFGYKKGLDFVKHLAGNMLQKVTEGASILGLFVMGALVSKWTTINVPLVVSRVTTNGKTTVTTVQNILDQLLPGLLALVLTLVVSKLLKKNISPIAIIFILFAVGIVGYGLGILA